MNTTGHREGTPITVSPASQVPADLHYTAEHEWIRRTDGGTVRVGITDFAQSALGDVVFVQLPAVGDTVTAGETFGEVESTKSVSDLYAPISAKVVAVNGDLEADPQLVNSDPYGAGWLADLRVEDAQTDALEQTLAALLSADAYRETLTE
jgi:glycine cleavage system H protein